MPDRLRGQGSGVRGQGSGVRARVRVRGQGQGSGSRAGLGLGSGYRVRVRKQGQGQEMGLGIEIGLESGSGLEGAPRASRRREGGEVRARANLDFRARRPPLPHRATGGLRQRPGDTPARVLVPNAAVRSGGAIGVGRAAAAWQQAAKRRAATNLHLVVDSRGGCAPAARHGLGIRHELASDAASGRIGRR